MNACWPLVPGVTYCRPAECAVEPACDAGAGLVAAGCAGRVLGVAAGCGSAGAGVAVGWAAGASLGAAADGVAVACAGAAPGMATAPVPGDRPTAGGRPSARARLLEAGNGRGGARGGWRAGQARRGAGPRTVAVACHGGARARVAARTRAGAPEQATGGEDPGDRGAYRGFGRCWPDCWGVASRLACAGFAAGTSPAAGAALATAGPVGGAHRGDPGNGGDRAGRLRLGRPGGGLPSGSRLRVSRRRRGLRRARLPAGLLALRGGRRRLPAGRGGRSGAARRGLEVAVVDEPRHALVGERRGG